MFREIAILSILGTISGATPAMALHPDAHVGTNYASSKISLKRVDPLAIAIEQHLKKRSKSLDFLTKRDRAAVVSFYGDRQGKPVWIRNGTWTSEARQIIFRISRAQQDGLDPAAYDLPSLGLGKLGPASIDKLAMGELMLSRAIATYARHAYAGQVDPRKISRNISLRSHLPASIKVLEDVSVALDPLKILASFHPTHRGFVELRKAYQDILLRPAGEVKVQITAGKTLRKGMRSERIALLRQRLNIETEDGNERIFDTVLLDAVKLFQKENGLIVDGIVGKATIKILNGAGQDLVADIIANLERWRWLPRDLGRFHVFVNIPSFEVSISKDNKQVHRTRIVVGKIKNQTPIFSDEIEHVVVNPYWNVPMSIASKELLPKIRANPGQFFSKRNYEVLAQIKGRTRIINPAKINWNLVTAKQIRLRQTPGIRNALGRIKFMFPNRHAVYLHDTPSKSLFKRDYRAFSHGCVRVLNPMDFADVILSELDGWDAKRVKKLIGGRERTIKLKEHIPVHLTYFTTYVDDNGKLQHRSDLYGHHRRVKKKLNI